VRTTAILICAIMLAACPKPRRPLVPSIPTDGDPAARDRFQKAQAVFRDDGASAADDFASIVEDFPDDPIVPWAQLYAGMAQFDAKNYAGADKALREVLDAEVDKGLHLRAELYLGMSRNYQGDHAGALPLLVRTEKAIEGDAERGEWIAAMAIASATAGVSPLDSLPYFDTWFGKATPPEQGFILARLADVIGGAAAADAKEKWDRMDGRGGPAAAILAYRVAADREAAGDPGGAKKIRDQVASVRKAIGLPLTGGAGAASSGDPGALGAVVPQTGKSTRVGELALQGLAVAASWQAFSIDVRAAGTAEEAGAAVDDLARAGAIAVVGPIDGAAVDSAAGRANAQRLPLLSLATRPEERASGRWTYHVVHSAEARARALARRAKAGGVTAFAIVSPESGYGRAVAAAFTAEVEHGGGKIVERETYPADAKAFDKIAKKLGTSWQAVFVPETADKLELIAPALANAGHLPRPLGTRKATGGRPVLLLSTAEGLATDFAADTGRHAEGAFLAPGFYPDVKDPIIADFVRRYETSIGKPPGVVDAYAYDAALVVAKAGARSRDELATRLDGAELHGVTGTLRFDGSHRRGDDGLVFVVVESAGAYELRAQR
jgi:ABC-type branched-subunit amino acid transport system substrate-binding protein